MDTDQFSQDQENSHDKAKKRSELQVQMVMIEADLRKKTAEKSQLETDIRKEKKQISSLKSMMIEKQETLQKCEQEIFEMETSLSSLRRKLNSIV